MFEQYSTARDLFEDMKIVFEGHISNRQQFLKGLLQAYW